METAELIPHIDVNKIIAVPVSNIRVAFNIRYGWEEGKILDAYQSGIDELETSIRAWGFKPNEPLEVYDSGEVDEEGNIIYNLAEGHRRFAAVQAILTKESDYNFGNGLANGEVWSFVSPKPSTMLDLLASQFDANKSAKNTRLDTAKAIHTAIESQEIVGKKINTYPIIGERIAGLKSWQSVESFYLTYQLPDTVKDWIQESELNEELPIALSFSTAAEIVTYYKISGAKTPDKQVEDASKLLLEALKRVVFAPEKVPTFGNKITKAWLHELAVELDLSKKPPTTKKETTKAKVDISPTPAPTTDNQGDLRSIESKASENIHPQAPTISTLDDTQPTVVATPTPTIQPPVTQKPKEAKSSEPTQSQDRVKTLILKMLSEQAGEHIVNGKSDVDSGVFIIELPVDIGENLAELVSSLIDPKSNPINEVSATSVIEEMEF